MEIQSSILPWRIPWTEKPGRPYSPLGRKESDMTKQLTLNTFFHFGAQKPASPQESCGNVLSQPQFSHLQDTYN